MKRALLLLAFVLLTSTDILAKCGKERWPVKTGTDPTTFRIDDVRLSTTPEPEDD